MHARVLLFGPQSAAAGADSIGVSVPPGATPADLLDAIGRACPALRQSLSASRLAVNGVFASAGTPIGEADELALIALVSGG